LASAEAAGLNLPDNGGHADCLAAAAALAISDANLNFSGKWGGVNRFTPADVEDWGLAEEGGGANALALAAALAFSEANLNFSGKGGGPHALISLRGRDVLPAVWTLAGRGMEAGSLGGIFVRDISVSSIMTSGILSSAIDNAASASFPLESSGTVELIRSC